MRVADFWAGVGAICAVLGVLGALCMFILRHVGLMIDARLSKFLIDLNGTYVRDALFREHDLELQRRLARLEAANDAR